MRRRDRRGDHECRGADWLIRSRMVSRWVGWKMAGSCKLVMRRVLEGGDGAINGGIEERSSDRGVWVPLDGGVEDCEMGGELVSVAILCGSRDLCST